MENLLLDVEVLPASSRQPYVANDLEYYPIRILALDSIKSRIRMQKLEIDTNVDTVFQVSSKGTDLVIEEDVCVDVDRAIKVLLQFSVDLMIA